MTTEEYITVISEQFEDWEKTVLEYQRKGEAVTVAEQLSTYYADLYPAYDEKKAIRITREILKNNFFLLKKIETNEETLMKLSNPESFQIKTKIEGNRESDKRFRSVDTHQAVEEILSKNKTRGGTTERSYDYQELENYWALKDKNEMTTDIQLQFKSALNLDAKNIEDVKIVHSYVTPDKNPTVEVPEPETEPYMNLLDTNMGFGKTTGKQIHNTDRYNQRTGKSTQGQTKIVESEAQNIINAINTELPVLRERFWNLFYYLFRDYCHCRCR